LLAGEGRSRADLLGVVLADRLVDGLHNRLHSVLDDLLGLYGRLHHLYKDARTG